MNEIVCKMTTKFLDTLRKHQFPSTKSQTISKFQFRITSGFVWDFGHLVIGDYLEFGIWILGFRYGLVRAIPG